MMVFIAAAHPLMESVAMLVVGLLAFAGIATVGRGRSVPTVSLIAVTLLVTGWLFGAVLVWRQTGVTRVRVDATWAQRSASWQWTALLVLGYAGVFAAAASLRGFSQERTGVRRWYATGSAVAFAAWSSIVDYPPAWAVLFGIVGVTALAGGGWRTDAGQRELRRQTVRVPLIIAGTVTVLVLIGVGFVAQIPTGG